MREIKFRAYYKQRFYYFIIGQFTQCFHSENNVYNEICLNSIPFEQFTGLFDGNGKEIYEGDILKASRKYSYMYESGYTGLIEFRKHYGDYAFGNIGGQLTLVKAIRSKVIGNIHENPELLNAV